MQEILTERPNLFEPNDYITFYIELDKKIQTKDLAEAIRAAYMANEATMSKIVLCPDGAAYYEKIPQSNCKVTISYDDWRKVIKVNEKIPFSLKDGELIRSFIFSTEKNTAFLIMAHHLVGDGKSIIYLIESILTALSGEKLPYRPLSLLTRETLSKTKKLPFAVTLYTKLCNQKWEKMGNPSFSWEDYYNLHTRYWESTSYVVYKRLSKEETTQIVDSAKQIGVSVNSYLITAFLQADKNNRVVGIPLSIRERGNKTMSNLTSGISITHAFADNKSFPENARQIHKKISRKLSAHRFFVLRFLANFSPSILDSVLLYTHHLYENPMTKRLAKTMGYVGTKTRDLGITNLTRLDIPAAYGTIKIRNVIFVPPDISYSHNVIGVSTFNGEMTLTYHGTETQKEKQQEFFKRGVKYALDTARNMRLS